MKTPDQPHGEANLNTQKGPSDFQQLMGKLFGPACIACHNSGRSAAGVNLETCETIIKGNARGKPLVVPGSPDSSALVAAIASGRMPPNGAKVSPDVVALLSSWIAAGATEETWSSKTAGTGTTGSGDQATPPVTTSNPRVPSVPPPTPTPPTVVVEPGTTPVSPAGTTYLAVKSELFLPKCMGCHSGEFAEGGVDLSTRDFIVGPPQPGSPASLVVPGNPDASLLMRVLQSQQMPPQGIPAPSAAAIARLREWIMTPEMP